MYRPLMEVKVEQGENGARGKRTGFCVFFLKQISWQLTVGSPQLTVGSPQLAVGSGQSAVNSPFLGG